MPAAGVARVYRAAESADDKAGRGRPEPGCLRRRCGPRCGGPPAPADGPAAPGGSHQEGSRSAL